MFIDVLKKLKDVLWKSGFWVGSGEGVVFDFVVGEFLWVCIL